MKRNVLERVGWMVSLSPEQRVRVEEGHPKGHWDFVPRGVNRVPSMAGEHSVVGSDRYPPKQEEEQGGTGQQ